MMKYFLLSIMLVPCLAHAQCEKAASSYGNGEGVDVIPSECKELVEKLAGPNAKREFKNASVKVAGYKNLLYVNGQIFAGEYTMLQDVIAVSWNEGTSEVAVLEKSGDVLVFNSKIAGNVAPLRVIRHQDLDGATDIKFLPAKDEIAVHLKGKSEVLTFSRMANFYGREGNKKLNVRRQIMNAKTLPEQ